jgi:adenylylsulfate kinase-like enzyme
VKGFYGKARAGVIKGFTGVDDPYEAPLNPEITLLTGKTTPQHNAEIIMEYLIGQGFLLRDTAEIATEEGEELLAAG